MKAIVLTLSASREWSFADQPPSRRAPNGALASICTAIFKVLFVSPGCRLIKTIGERKARPLVRM
jgi:hypothetical protein